MTKRMVAAACAVLTGVALFTGAVVVAGERPQPIAPRFARVQLATGPTIHYAVQGPADGPVVILLHGFSDSWYSWSPLLPLLPESWSVYALTQRGHGDSDRPAGDYSPPTFARDVLAFMDAAGIERASIVGHSLGGIVAQHVAAAAPERVERLVIVGSVATAQTMPGMAEFRAAIHELPDPVPVEFARGFQESTLHVRPSAAFVDSVVAESAKLPAHVWRGVIDGLLETGPAAGLDAFDAPALVLWGERDGYMPYADQLDLVRSLRARLVVYHGIGHGMHWEAPDQVARDLIAFIDDR